jgi:acyl carrier protein
MSKEGFEQQMKAIFKRDDLPLDLVIKQATDSLGLAEIILYAEEELGVMLSNEQIFAIKTYGDLAQILGLTT